MSLCVRVYNNGDRVISRREGQCLLDWLTFNKQHRWGLALFVDGVCKANGYLSTSKIAELEKEFQDDKFKNECKTMMIDDVKIVKCMR